MRFRRNGQLAGPETLIGFPLFEEVPAPLGKDGPPSPSRESQRETSTLGALKPFSLDTLAVSRMRAHVESASVRVRIRVPAHPSDWRSPQSVSVSYAHHCVERLIVRMWIKLAVLLGVLVAAACADHDDARDPQMLRNAMEHLLQVRAPRAKRHNEDPSSSPHLYMMELYKRYLTSESMKTRSNTIRSLTPHKGIHR